MEQSRHRNQFIPVDMNTTNLVVGEEERVAAVIKREQNRLYINLLSTDITVRLIYRPNLSYIEYDYDVDDYVKITHSYEEVIIRR